jgi:hypothetical protein
MLIIKQHKNANSRDEWIINFWHNNTKKIEGCSYAKRHKNLKWIKKYLYKCIRGLRRKTNILLFLRISNKNPIKCNIIAFKYSFLAKNC